VTVPGPGWHPLALRPRRRTSVAAATDHRIVLDEGRSSVIRWIGLHVTGGQRGDTDRLPTRMERPVLCTVVCRFERRPGASRGRPFSTSRTPTPLLVGARSDPRQGDATRALGRAAGPAAGQDPAAGCDKGLGRVDTPIEAAGATTGSGDHLL